jgi:hypothetical protein
MRLVTRDTGLGLVVAEEVGDEARLGRELKQIDDRLVLQKHPGPVEGGWVYKVFCVVSEEQEAVCVCVWSDRYGNPLPLSTGLVTLVESLRPEARSRRGPDADAQNAALLEANARRRESELAAIADDHRPYLERGRVSVSLAGSPSRGLHWHSDETA